jgi:hypothetical protein
MFAASILIVAVLGAGFDAASAAPSARQDASPPATLSREEVRSQVQAYVSAIDTPIPPAAWRALGPRAGPMLRQLISDPETFPTRRAKAINGLTAVDGEAAESLFRQLAGAASEPLVVRLAALRGMGQVTEAQALATELGPFLSGANDSRVRAYAGEVLIRKSGRSECASVRAQAGSELPERQGHFERALALCADK